MSADLVLIRHAQPNVDPSIPAARWPLAQDGRAAAMWLGEELRAFDIEQLVSSEEPKAAGTAEAIAAALDVPWSTVPNLGEHGREALPWLGADAWHAQLKRFFETPDELVFGLETAAQALTRFAGAVDEARKMSQCVSGRLGIVSHGTVMALYIARLRDESPYSIWRNLKMPDYVVL